MHGIGQGTGQVKRAFSSPDEVFGSLFQQADTFVEIEHQEDFRTDFEPVTASQNSSHNQSLVLYTT